MVGGHIFIRKLRVVIELPVWNRVAGDIIYHNIRHSLALPH